MCNLPTALLHEDIVERHVSLIAPEATCTYLVFFGWDRAELPPPPTRIEVGGGTDRSGTAAELARDGIQGYGEDKPLMPTTRRARKPRNRRVEIILR